MYIHRVYMVEYVLLYVLPNNCLIIYFLTTKIVQRTIYLCLLKKKFSSKIIFQKTTKLTKCLQIGTVYFTEQLVFPVAL